MEEVSRRQFTRMLTGALAVTASSSLPLVVFAEDNPDAKTTGVAAALYERAFVLDCNSGPPLADSTVIPKASLDMTRKSGVTAVKFGIGGINASFEDALSEIAFMERVIETYPGYFLQVRTHSDFDRAHGERKLGVVFSFESVEMLAGKLERIELFRNLGVRVMQLSYNGQSPFASGALAQGGLTPLGRKAIGKMNEAGVALDLSHSNQETTREALAASTKPVLITHAGCAAVHAHPRNKSDEILRAVANKGGVIGIYMLPYLTASPKQPNVDDYISHMAHALTVAGEDHVGVGSDVGMEPFDKSPASIAEFNKIVEQRKKAGVSAPEEDRPPYVEGLNSPRKIELIADALVKRGYSTAVVEKVIGANFYRAFKEIWGAGVEQDRA
jgi:membrane dipeptidase